MPGAYSLIATCGGITVYSLLLFSMITLLNGVLRGLQRALLRGPTE